MHMMAHVIKGMGLLAVAGFCAFGFLATFEPMDASKQLFWRTVYGVIFLASLGGLVLLALPRQKGP